MGLFFNYVGCKWLCSDVDILPEGGCSLTMWDVNEKEAIMRIIKAGSCSLTMWDVNFEVTALISSAISVVL